jgi:hypothetical protein
VAYQSIRLLPCVFVNLDYLERLQVYFLDDPLSAVDAHV